ncbi:hypothetical protein BS17DRAFT_666980, partial [Gyrodon lividus]
NIVLFGEIGVGKSSVVNLLAGYKVAEISENADPCTQRSQGYEIVLDGKTYCIWDTVGLLWPGFGYGGEIDQYEYVTTVQDVNKLISRRSQVDLLLFCLRGGRVTAWDVRHYGLIHEVLCAGTIPVGVVFTNLENENILEEWGRRNVPKVQKLFGMKFEGYACVTAVPGQ